MSRGQIWLLSDRLAGTHQLSSHNVHVFVRGEPTVSLPPAKPSLPQVYELFSHPELLDCSTPPDHRASIKKSQHSPITATADSRSISSTDSRRPASAPLVASSCPIFASLLAMNSTTACTLSRTPAIPPAPEGYSFRLSVRACGPFTSSAPRSRSRLPIPSIRPPSCFGVRPVKLQVDGRGAVDEALDSKLHPRGFSDSSSKERGFRRRGVLNSAPREIPRPVVTAELAPSSLVDSLLRTDFADRGKLDLSHNQSVHITFYHSFSLMFPFSRHTDPSTSTPPTSQPPDPTNPLSQEKKQEIAPPPRPKPSPATKAGKSRG